MVKTRFFHLDLRKLKNNMVILERLYPSHCEICERIHEKQNSFLFLIEDKVYWNCWRCEGKNY